MRDTQRHAYALDNLVVTSRDTLGVHSAHRPEERRSRVREGKEGSGKWGRFALLALGDVRPLSVNSALPS